MNTPVSSSAASRLCAACGMCCNGVMFHTVRLQPADSARELSALGLKLKRKKGQRYILQPCPMFRESRCSIYEARPERCRLFECRQLQGVASGAITEAMARKQIDHARQQVAEVNQLLHASGGTNLKRPLTKRFDKAMAEPLDASSEAAAVALRTQLVRAMQELNDLLDREFRVTPPGPAARSCDEAGAAGVAGEAGPPLFTPPPVLAPGSGKKLAAATRKSC